MVNKNRFFLIAYNVTDSLNNIIQGNIYLTTESGKYPSKKYINKLIKDSVNNNFKFNEAFILNIIELNESDYNDLMSDE